MVKKWAEPFGQRVRTYITHPEPAEVTVSVCQGGPPSLLSTPGPALLEVASVEDSVQNRDGRPASDPPRRGNSSQPQLRQLFQAADGGDLVGHHLVALNSWDASTVQPKRFLRRRPSLPTTRMRRWLCWGSSATHRPWHTPEAGTVQMLSVFVVGRACVVSKGPSVSSKVWELSLSRCSRINTPPVTPNSETRK